MAIQYSDSDSHLKLPIGCLNPQRIYNPYLGEWLMVPCRHCTACKNAYALTLTQRIENECKQHVYSFFFTLTYDNKHLPMYQLVTDCKASTLPTFVSNRPDDFHKSFYQFCDYYPQASKQFKKGFGYCCRSDVQKFMKRLRRRIETSKYLKNETKESKKIRYFIASEYGPRTFRPHYHGILWTDNKHVANRIQSLIYSSWSLCSRNRIDVQLVNGSAPGYVAKYVNGFTNLPKVLQLKSTCPFHLASKNPILGDFKINDEDIQKMLFDGIVSRPVPNVETQQNDDVLFPNSYYTRFFPKCTGYGTKTHFDKLSILERYETFVNCHSHVKISSTNTLSIFSEHRNSFLAGLTSQDLRFCRAASNWHYLYNISYDTYLYYLERLYSNRELRLLSDSYELQQKYLDKYKSPLKVLKFYPLLFFSLPEHMCRNEWFASPLYQRFRSLNIFYDDIYHRDIRIDGIDIFIDDDTEFYSKMSSKIQSDGLKNKALNETMSDLFTDY